MHAPSCPRQLLLLLVLYFGGLVGAISLITIASPGVANWLPIGGTDAIEIAALEVENISVVDQTGKEIVDSRIAGNVSARDQWLVLLFLLECLALSVLIMLPISWTYLATHQVARNRASFARALIILPVCATTIVLLIQGSLALAFGLAAMVAAVRFRVRLDEPIDGIYIFSAVSVGLAGGIGYMGIATVMAAFFCFANAILWLRKPAPDS